MDTEGKEANATTRGNFKIALAIANELNACRTQKEITETLKLAEQIMKCREAVAIC